MVSYIGFFSFDYSLISCNPIVIALNCDKSFHFNTTAFHFATIGTLGGKVLGSFTSPDVTKFSFISHCESDRNL